MRCPLLAACSLFAEHLYDVDLGNLNHATDYALRIVEMHLIRPRVLGDLESGAGARHDLGEGKTYGSPSMPGDTAKPVQQQYSTGLQSSRASPVTDDKGEKEEYYSKHCQRHNGPEG